MNRIIYIGSYIRFSGKQTWTNPQRGSVFSSRGIAPCMMDFSGGGNLAPTIIVIEDDL